MAHPSTTTQPPGALHVNVLRAEVQEFLNRFAAALLAGDGDTIAALWEVPAFVIGREGVHAIASHAQISQFFGGARQQYNERGITGTRADLIDLERIDDRIVVATVRWPHLDAKGREVAAESSDYTLRRDDRGVLKLRSVLMRGMETPR